MHFASLYSPNNTINHSMDDSPLFAFFFCLSFVCLVLVDYFKIITRQQRLHVPTHLLLMLMVRFVSLRTPELVILNQMITLLTFDEELSSVDALSLSPEDIFVFFLTGFFDDSFLRFSPRLPRLGCFQITLSMELRSKSLLANSKPSLYCLV